MADTKSKIKAWQRILVQLFAALVIMILIETIAKPLSIPEPFPRSFLIFAIVGDGLIIMFGLWQIRRLKQQK
jgi:hypothetical protein